MHFLILSSIQLESSPLTTHILNVSCLKQLFYNTTEAGSHTSHKYQLCPYTPVYATLF